MQVGPIKYSKAEERIFFKSIVLGILLGLPVAVIPNYMLGFPTLITQAPNNFVGWVMALSSFLASMIWAWFLIAIFACFTYYRKEKMLDSWHSTAKIIWIFIVYFPIMFSYTILIFSALFVPLNYATPWLNPIRQYWLGCLLFLPFVFLFFATFLPDQKPRKILHQIWLILKRTDPPPKLDLRKALEILPVFVWLLLVFLPLPDSFPLHLAMVMSGFAVLVFYTKNRIKAKKKKSRLYEVLEGK